MGIRLNLKSSFPFEIPGLWYKRENVAFKIRLYILVYEGFLIIGIATDYREPAE